MKKNTLILTGIALTAAAGLAFAQMQKGPDDMPSGAHAMSHGSAHATTPSSDPVIRAYQATNDKMHADMAVAFTGNADVDFARAMIPHHEGAVAMARIALEHGRDPEIRRLAEDVVKAQEAEIATMRSWLARNEPPRG
ncbi:MAG: DUF305 domain-containing protein [Allosphingosinicella sp.]|uniref:CopM family metallochaperone n=1 Tax=Allosphingosinicella sp. TaxID=2823234 RepID=UPI0039631DDA